MYNFLKIFFNNYIGKAKKSIKKEEYKKRRVIMIKGISKKIILILYWYCKATYNFRRKKILKCLTIYNLEQMELYF